MPWLSWRKYMARLEAIKNKVDLSGESGTGKVTYF